MSRALRRIPPLPTAVCIDDVSYGMSNLCRSSGPQVIDRRKLCIVTVVRSIRCTVYMHCPSITEGRRKDPYLVSGVNDQDGLAHALQQSQVNSVFRPAIPEW